ncbi:MAG: TIGR02266 family protein [Myxococcota bacterium]
MRAVDFQSPTPPEKVRVERRSSRRVGFSVRVDYKTVDELFSEFAQNVNEGGLFIQTDEPPEIGASIALEFRIPETEAPIQVIGRVVRLSDGLGPEPPGMGVQFENLDAEARDTINELVRALRVGANR